MSHSLREVCGVFRFSVIWDTDEQGPHRLLFADDPVSVPIPHPAVGGMPSGDRRNPVPPRLGTGDAPVAVVIPEPQGIDTGRVRLRR